MHRWHQLPHCVRLSEIPHVPDGGSITLLLQQQQPSSQTLFRHIALKQQSLKYINTPGAVGHHKCRTGPPVAVFAHYTHCKQFDSCCYICTSQHEQTWTWIFSLMTHFMGPVQWPWTSANVNDALRVSGHRLAKREAHYSQRSFFIPPTILPLFVTGYTDHTNYNVIIIRGWWWWLLDRAVEHVLRNELLGESAQPSDPDQCRQKHGWVFVLIYLWNVLKYKNLDLI